MASCFRKELFSSCQNVHCIPDSRSTMARSVCCTALEKTSDQTTLQTDPIISCFAASSSNTPGRHCRKYARTFSKRTNSRLGLARTCVFDVRMFDRGSFCLYWRHKGGRQSPPTQHYRNQVVSMDHAQIYKTTMGAAAGDHLMGVWLFTSGKSIK